MKKSTPNLFLLLLLPLALLAVIAFAAMPDSKPPEETQQSESESLLRGYYYEDLLHETPIIVVAEVTEIAEPIQIQHASGDAAVNNFTDYTITVSDVLRGEMAIGDSLTVRLEGGEVNGLNVVSEDAPTLALGDQRLFFLYQPNMGGGYNTEGDYTYIVGVNQGVFTEADSTYHNITELSLTLDSLREDLNALSPEETQAAIDPQRPYHEFLENQQHNLDNGMISQAEYDRLLEEAQTYATVVG